MIVRFLFFFLFYSFSGPYKILSFSFFVGLSVLLKELMERFQVSGLCIICRTTKNQSFLNISFFFTDGRGRATGRGLNKVIIYMIDSQYIRKDRVMWRTCS